MQIALFGVIGLITIVVAGAFSAKLSIASPLILIVIGVGYSFIPLAPDSIPHELILFGLLPPILYAASITVPIVDFRRNFGSISALSVGLVIATALVTGAILSWILPGLSFAAGIAIGAVISPTDAIAATAVGKKLGLPPRLVTILEGESLVNDATALVLLRSAIAATAATVSFWDVVGDFAFAVALAVAIGLSVGFITVWVRSKIRDPLLDTAISFAVPFIAFIPTEFAGASGVLAVVVAGLYSGHHGARRFSAQARVAERLNWRTVQFLLENGVFLLMGVQISGLIASVHEDDLSADKAIYLGLLMTVVVLAIRFVFIGPLLVVLRAQLRRAERFNGRFGRALDRMRSRPAANDRRARQRKRAETVHERRGHDARQLRAEGLGWRGGAILGWSGMRGVVTLAAAQSLPESTPYRPQLVLIAFTVAIVTLLLQGGTLPWVIRLTGVQGSDAAADGRELAALLDDLAEAGLAAVDSGDIDFADGQEVDPAVIERVRNDSLLRAESAWERVQSPAERASSPQRQYRILRREMLRFEREALLEARAAGRYPSRVLTRAQAILDLEETRMEQAGEPDRL